MCLRTCERKERGWNDGEDGEVGNRRGKEESEEREKEGLKERGRKGGGGDMIALLID